MLKLKEGLFGFIVYLFIIILMLFMGYYYLSLGLQGAIDFGTDYTYLNKLIWFFGSVSLISAKGFFLDLKSLKAKCVVCLITFMTMTIGFTFTGGVSFDAGDYSLGINAVLIAKSVFVIVVLAVVVVAMIMFLFTDTPTQLAKTGIKIGAILGVVVLSAVYVMPLIV